MNINQLRKTSRRVVKEAAKPKKGSRKEGVVFEKPQGEIPLVGIGITSSFTVEDELMATITASWRITRGEDRVSQFKGWRCSLCDGDSVHVALMSAIEHRAAMVEAHYD